MQTEKQRIGALGEELAVMFLVKRGFSVIGRNIREKWGEIDIIAQKQGILHFFEVKSVSRETKNWPILGKDNYYRPEENVHELKQKRLGRTIETFLMKHRLRNTSWQFHVITVYIDEKAGKSDIHILENVIL